MTKTIDIKTSSQAQSVTPSIQILIAADYSQSWYKDSLNEAVAGDDVDSCRREIIFAVCFAESYIVEWVRDTLVNGDVNRLAEKLTKNSRKNLNVKEKWQRLKRFYENNEIAGVISFDTDTNENWRDFIRLVDLRNGIVHAAVSIPESSLSSTKWRDNLPTPTDLNRVPNGWATQVVYKLVKSLHDAVGTKPPDWLIKPS